MTSQSQPQSLPQKEADEASASASLSPLILPLPLPSPSKSKSKSQSPSSPEDRSSSHKQNQRLFSGRTAFLLAVLFLVISRRWYNEYSILADIMANDTAETAQQTITSNGTETETKRPRNATRANKPAKPQTPYRLDANSTELWEWRKQRVNRTVYKNFFRTGKGTGHLRRNADRKGPILDFIIAGFPKCGTTAMMRTLSSVTTMPSSMDVRTPIRKAVAYSYQTWPVKYGKAEAWKYLEDKPLKGTKCPYYLESPDLKEIADQLPKAGLIVGIRHPALWFQSFANMYWASSFRRHKGDPTKFLWEKLLAQAHGSGCWSGKKRINVCIARSRFHLALARLGKTPLDPNEMRLLGSELDQAKRRRNETSSSFQVDNKQVPNSVFLYDSTQGKEEYFYQELADFVGINASKIIPYEYHAGHGINNPKRAERIEKDGFQAMDFCEPRFDYVRQELLPISYNLGQWLLQYLIPASRQRDDLVIPNVTHFEAMAKTYLRDPCNDRLVRNATDGEFYLNHNHSNSDSDS